MSSRLSITSYVILGMVALRGPSASATTQAGDRSVGWLLLVLPPQPAL